MNRDIAQELYLVYARATSVLDEAGAIIRRIPEKEERSPHLLALGGLFGDIAINLRAPLIRQYPDLDTNAPDLQPDSLIDPEDQAAVSRLTAVELALIDEELLASCASTWRKVARVVGTAMMAIGERHPDIPDSYYAQRVAALVHSGALESQGNLDYMRYSEVRLPEAIS